MLLFLDIILTYIAKLLFIITADAWYHVNMLTFQMLWHIFRVTDNPITHSVMACVVFSLHLIVSYLDNTHYSILTHSGVKKALQIGY